MTSNGDVIQATFTGKILGQTWNWVQSYLVRDIVGGPLPDANFLGMVESLYNGVRDDFATYVAPSLSSATQLTGCRAENIFSETAFGEWVAPVPTAGGVGTDPLPSFVAVRLRSPTKRKGMRSASKFIPGMVESLVTNGHTITAANVAAMQTFADNFGAGQFVDAGGGFTFWLDPICVKRIFEGVVNGKRRYRMPAGPGELVYYYTDAYVCLNTVTTMNSRKVGYGV